MKSYARSHLADESLASTLVTGATCVIDALADHLADLAEFDARQLYLPAAYPSMLAYCKDKLPLPESASRKHLHAARTARLFPAIFPALADGRLHLSGVILLAPHLSAGNADVLLAAAAHKSKFEIEQLIAKWFPKLDVPTTFHALEEAVTTGSCAPGRTIPSTAGQGAEAPPPARTTVTPLASQRFELTMTIDQETLDQLHYAQALLGHTVPTGDLAAVLKRLVPREHNQYQAERTFGAEFMRCKREAARERAIEKRARTGAAHEAASDREEDPDRDVAPWLRALGVRGDDLRRGVAAAGTIPDAPLEERVRLAVSTLTRAGRRQGAAFASSA